MSDESDAVHELGRETMSRVYAWGPTPELPGEFFKVTVDHLFGEIWNREGLTIRDRRLLLFGVIAALGEGSVLPIQIDAALSNEEFTPDELREIAIFLTHYIGWPRGAAFNTTLEDRIAKHRGTGSQQKFPTAREKT